MWEIAIRGNKLAMENMPLVTNSEIRDNMPTMEAGLVDLTLSWCSKGGEMSPTEGVEARVRVWDWGLRRGAW